MDDLEQEIRREGWIERGDPALLHLAYWPDRDYPPELEILVAGCGTNQAAHIAYTNPGAKVLGIDVSASSLEQARHLKQKSRLENLELLQLPVEEISTLGRGFDLILCTGVLHHLKSPVKALRELRGVLRPEGVAVLMVYSRYNRTGVYMLQELFRALGLRQDAEGVELVKATLTLLPGEHLLRTYLAKAPDLDYDSGLVDTFLHRRDRAYTVPQCLRLIQDSGLRFQGWIDNFYYYPEAAVSEMHPLYPRLSRLEAPKIWQAMELLSLQWENHALFACRPERPEHSYVIDLDREDLLEHIPVKSFGIRTILHLDLSREPPFRFQRLNHPPTDLTVPEFLFFSRINGHRTVAEAIRASDLEGAPREREAFARRFVKRLWRMGHILLRLPAVAA
jgi:SAM-dependent methyltransferase